MTRRLILIEIDAEETTCGRCRGRKIHEQHSPLRSIRWATCEVFGQPFDWPLDGAVRLPQCLAADRTEAGK